MVPNGDQIELPAIVWHRAEDGKSNKYQQLISNRESDCTTLELPKIPIAQGKSFVLPSFVLYLTAHPVFRISRMQDPFHLRQLTGV